MDGSQTEAVAQYLRDLCGEEDDVLVAIREEGAQRGLPPIHIEPEAGCMLQFLLMAIGAKRVAEIGALAGYSGVWIARALPEGGRLITLEKDPERVALARASFERAGLSARAEVRVAEAPEGLAALAVDGPFDAVFIDADKQNYPVYLDWALENVRVGGLIMAHNALWYGRVLDPAQRDDRDVRGLREFNQRISQDPRLKGIIIPVGDGLAAGLRVR